MGFLRLIGPFRRPSRRPEMRNTLLALAAATSITAATLAAPSPAEAGGCLGCAVGGGGAGGVLPRGLLCPPGPRAPAPFLPPPAPAFLCGPPARPGPGPGLPHPPPAGRGPLLGRLPPGPTRAGLPVTAMTRLADAGPGARPRRAPRAAVPRTRRSASALRRRS